MSSTRLVSSEVLRQHLAAYLDQYGYTSRLGRNGRRHRITSRSSYLRRLIERRFGTDAPLSQQAINNFISGRTRSIGLEHARMLMIAVGARLTMVTRRQS